MKLPYEVVTEPAGSGRRAGASPHIALSGRRLLVVDDEPECRKLLVVMLEQVGMSCTTASNGPEASILQQKPVDAVIADLNMPRVSGLELLAQVRRFYPQQVFLMAT